MSNVLSIFFSKNFFAESSVNLALSSISDAAVLLSDRLAAKTDFFSIGTNDLAQYTLAVDRQSTLEYMNRVYNPHHPAILEFIRMTVENAHRHQKRVCICGEMGSDLSLLDWFVEIGVDSLSIAPVVVH